MIDRPLELIRSKDVSAVCEREKSFEKKKEKKKGISAGKKERKEANRQDGKKGGRCGPNSSVHLTGWRERRVVPAIELVMPAW